jgi:hypothetical protein
MFLVLRKSARKKDEKARAKSRLIPSFFPFPLLLHPGFPHARVHAHVAWRHLELVGAYEAFLQLFVPVWGETLEQAAGVLVFRHM